MREGFGRFIGSPSRPEDPAITILTDLNVANSSGLANRLLRAIGITSNYDKTTRIRIYNDIVQQLHDVGKLNEFSTVETGYSPLICGLLKRSGEFISILLENNVDISREYNGKPFVLYLIDYGDLWSEFKIEILEKIRSEYGDNVFTQLISENPPKTLYEHLDGRKEHEGIKEWFEDNEYNKTAKQVLAKIERNAPARAKAAAATAEALRERDKLYANLISESNGMISFLRGPGGATAPANGGAGGAGDGSRMGGGRMRRGGCKRSRKVKRGGRGSRKGIRR